MDKIFKLQAHPEGIFRTALLGPFPSTANRCPGLLSWSSPLVEDTHPLPTWLSSSPGVLSHSGTHLREFRVGSGATWASPGSPETGALGRIRSGDGTCAWAPRGPFPPHPEEPARARCEQAGLGAASGKRFSRTVTTDSVARGTHRLDCLNVEFTKYFLFHSKSRPRPGHPFKEQVPFLSD